MLIDFSHEQFKALKALVQDYHEDEQISFNELGKPKNHTFTDWDKLKKLIDKIERRLN